MESPINAATPALPAAGANEAPLRPSANSQQPTFGRLESVRVRQHWKDEAQHFTPWLAREENLSLLGETLRLNLELVGKEQYIGPYKADIVARDDGHLVVIENQLDATDHKHLGQLMVYAAGLDARTAVWIARQVTAEHRKAMDWLNAETSTNFWALEIELWRIGNSPVAPKFNVVCEPNELAKTGADESAELTETKLAQLEFWKGFSEYLDKSDTSLNSRKPFPQNWYDLGIGTSRAYISCTVLISKKGRLGCELYIPGRQNSDAIFQALVNDKAAIETDIGPLEWQNLPEKKACRIADYKQPVDFEDRAKWDDLFAWLRDRAEAFKQTFAQRVKDMDLPEPQEAPVGASADFREADTGQAKAKPFEEPLTDSAGQG